MPTTMTFTYKLAQYSSMINSISFGTGALLYFFFFNDPATTEFYPLPLHDPLPIYTGSHPASRALMDIVHLVQSAVAPVFLLSGVAATLAVLTNRLARAVDRARALEERLERSEEHTSELQSPCNLVCRRLPVEKYQI